MGIQQLTDGNASGALMGRSDDKLGFYGLTTPIVKPDITAVGTTTATTTLTELRVTRLYAALGAAGLNLIGTGG